MNSRNFFFTIVFVILFCNIFISANLFHYHRIIRRQLGYGGGSVGPGPSSFMGPGAMSGIGLPIGPKSFDDNKLLKQRQAVHAANVKNVAIQGLAALQH